MSDKIRQHNSTLSADPAKGLTRRRSLREITAEKQAASQTATGAPRRPRSLSRRAKPISEASKEQRAAVAGQPCIHCGREASAYVLIDPAHIWKRGRGGCDDELCVVPLCRTFDGGCHALFDEGALDLLAVLVTDWPRWKLWFDHATGHATPVEVIERLAGERTQWSSAA